MAQRAAQRPNGASQAKIFQFKLVLLGESAVGKSSLVLRFVKGQFHEFQESTIGAAFLTQTVVIDDTTVKFEIWDTAGQERYHSLAPMYYRGAQAAIVVYDLTNAESFNKAKTWVKELQRQASPNIVIALGGNKADLPAEKRAVSFEEAQAYAEENGLLFLETSAKSAQNVNEIFMAIARSCRVQQTEILPVVPPAPALFSYKTKDNSHLAAAASHKPNRTGPVELYRTPLALDSCYIEIFYFS